MKLTVLLIASAVGVWGQQTSSKSTAQSETEFVSISAEEKIELLKAQVAVLRLAAQQARQNYEALAARVQLENDLDLKQKALFSTAERIKQNHKCKECQFTEDLVLRKVDRKK